MKLSTIINEIKEPNKQYYQESKSRWDKIAKPLNSLGALEHFVSKVASISENVYASLDKKALVIMCADNGVVAQGVSQVDNSVTAIVTYNFTKGESSVCIMAKEQNVDVIPVDIGIVSDLNNPLVLNRKVLYGTNDFTVSPAMTREEAIKAIEIGIDIVKDLKEQGYNLVALGEMGIGNTTTSSALASLLLNLDVEIVTGKGAGLSSEGLTRKVNAIKKGITVNTPNIEDPLDILHKMGGLDIAGLTGIILGCAYYKIPVLLDGLITQVAAVIAKRLSNTSVEYMIASHQSDEPASKLLLQELGLKAIINANMCLGEGTGALASLAVYNLGAKIYHNMVSFTDIGIDDYVHHEAKNDLC